MRRLLLGILLLVPLLSGCWDQYAIERLGFATIVGVDGSPGRIHAIVGTVVPENLTSITSSGQASRASTNFAGDGRTLYDAVRAADEHAPRRLYFGQIQDVIVSEELAAAGGLPDVLDYFGRENKSRTIAWVYVAKSQDLPTLMQLKPVNAAYPAEALDNLSLTERIQSDVAPRRIFEVGNLLTATGEEVSIPRITALGQNFALDGMDLFTGTRLVGHIGGGASRGIALISGHAVAPALDAKCPSGGEVSIDLQATHPSLGANVVQGDVRSLWLSLKATGHITQMSSCPGNLAGPLFRKQIYDSAASRLEQLLATTIHELQVNKSDAVGFGEQIREHQPAAWSRVATHWSDGVFPHLGVTIHVQIAASNSGLLDRGIK
ncbi:MAG: Ger(x)C family spore germination protein [Thermaerobacter sp.]|nr:Ger(x)C family spore germination protein [Thermaerobacter sp.]